MNDARDKVAEVLDQVLDDCVISEEVVSKHVVKDQADALIDYIWSRAHEPLVLEGVITYLDMQGLPAHRARGIVDALLTQLLGPRKVNEGE